MEVKEVKVKDIKRPGMNPRSINKAELKKSDLFMSIKKNGVMQPIQVHKVNGHFNLLAGDRRLTCAEMAGLEVINCIITEKLTEEQQYDVTHFENADREDLTSLEKAKDAEQLLKVHGNTKDVSNILCCTEQQVKMRIAVLKLTKSWKIWLKENDEIPIANLAVIARLPAAVQDEIFEDEIQYGDVDSFLGSTKALEEMINSRYTKCIEMAPWAEEKCATCKKRTNAKQQADLWGTENKETKKGVGFCLDTECWEQNRKIYQQSLFQKVLDANPEAILFINGYASAEDIRQLTVKFKRDVKCNWQSKYTIKEKANKNTVQAINMDSMTYDIIYVQSKAGKKIEQKVVGAVKTLAERRVGHRSKIWHATIAEVQNMLPEIKFKDTNIVPTDMPLLISIFGTMDKADYRNKEQWDIFGDGLDVNEINEYLFEELIKVFSRRIKHSYGVTQIPTDLLKEVESQCKLLDIDLQATYEKHKAEMPEPKSWANLNADGTPKEKGK